MSLRLDYLEVFSFISSCNNKDMLSSALKQYKCVLTWGVIVRQIHRLLIVLPIIVSIS